MDREILGKAVTQFARHADRYPVTRFCALARAAPDPFFTSGVTDRCPSVTSQAQIWVVETYIS